MRRVCTRLTSFLRIELRHEGESFDLKRFGTVCETSRVGRSIQAILLDPDRGALAELKRRADIHDYGESPVGLEDCYAALTRPGHELASAGAGAEVLR